MDIEQNEVLTRSLNELNESFLKHKIKKIIKKTSDLHYIVQLLLTINPCCKKYPGESKTFLDLRKQ